MTRKKKKQNTGRYIKWTIVVGLGVAMACSGKLQTYINWDAIKQDAQALFPETHSPSPAPEGLEIPLTTSGKQGQIIVHTGHTLAYDSHNKTPQWVAWELTREETEGQEQRTNIFQPDPNLRNGQVEHSDYTHSGYYRGHMAPAGDMKWDKNAMQESFYMSNICPQDHNLNTGRWNDLENKCRTWARKYNKVYVACGPVYQGKRNEYIGKRRVKVPDAFFKVILINDTRKQAALGFYFENKECTLPLKEYLLSVDEIEKLTGLDFFSALPDDLENRLEKETLERLP